MGKTPETVAFQTGALFGLLDAARGALSIAGGNIDCLPEDDQDAVRQAFANVNDVLKHMMERRRRMEPDRGA